MLDFNDLSRIGKKIYKLVINDIEKFGEFKRTTTEVKQMYSCHRRTVRNQLQKIVQKDDSLYSFLRTRKSGGGRLKVIKKRDSN